MNYFPIMAQMNAIIADDHSFIRMALKQIIQKEFSATVHEAEEGKQVLNILRSHDINLIVLDISMPGRNGIEVMKDINNMYPDIPVLILSGYSEDQYAMRALKAGASGYLTKDTAPQNLVEAINTIRNGDQYITPKLAQKLVKEFKGGFDNKPLHESLSDREYEVFCLIGFGLTISEIAEKQLLSPKTVSTYRARILKKMNIKNNAEIMKYVIENGLLDK